LTNQFLGSNEVVFRKHRLIWLGLEMTESEEKHRKALDLGLGRGVLGDGLGALRDGVLGKFTREDETDGGLDLA